LRLAIVGGGVAGLVTAHLLHRQGHDATVFEADDRLGGHACTLDAELGDGRIRGVDVGFLVLNDRNYPRFSALLTELGVATRESDMSFSVSDGRDFEFAGNGPRGLFANPRHLTDRAFLRMVAEYRRFNDDARALLASDEDPSLLGWLTGLGYSDRFIHGLIAPQAAAVWSTDPAQLWEFPARFLVRFFDNHGMLGLRGRPTWQTVVGGSRTYVEAIVRRVGPQRFRTGTAVLSVTRDDDGVTVVPAGGPPERFDEVVLACHSDQALALLGPDATPAEREVLGAIPYGPSELVLHHDRALLPRRRAAWASWNAHLLPENQRPAAPAVTYWLNNLQGFDAPRELLVTLNLTDRIDPATIQATMPVAHPTYTPEGVRAQERWAEISGVRRIHFAGAYWTWGFHEDGVRSAHRVAEAIGAAREPAAV
jgi:predicted NAD/FAD-binding protein